MVTVVLRVLWRARRRLSRSRSVRSLCSRSSTPSTCWIRITCGDAGTMKRTGTSMIFPDFNLNREVAVGTGADSNNRSLALPGGTPVPPRSLASVKARCTPLMLDCGRNPPPAKEHSPVGSTFTRGDDCLAERVGFEPTRPFWGPHALQACALNQTRPSLRD